MQDEMKKAQKLNLVLLAVIFVSVLVVGFSVLAWQVYKDYLATEEEGLVYVSILSAKPNNIDFNNVVALSKPSQCTNNFETKYEGLPKDVVQNFIEANSDSAKPVRLTALEGKVPIVSWKYTQHLYKTGTEEFFHPKGYKLLLFSRAGFNKEFSKAITCISISIGSVGQGLLIYLNKAGENWVIVETRRL